MGGTKERLTNKWPRVFLILQEAEWVNTEKQAQANPITQG